MIAVIIAGGSGTRLWPLSTPDYPKQLLKLNGEARSLVQQTYDRATRVAEHIYVVPEQSHRQFMQEQLPELPRENFIVEPGRRGTANCIVAALDYISKRHDATEPIAFISADHYIRDIDGFVHSFKIAEEVSAAEKRLVLVGVEPTYPATGFGYIEKGEVYNEEKFVFNVRSFKEKPDYQTAGVYLAEGKYLWNCGYFVGSIDTFTAKMQAHAPELHQTFTALQSADDRSYDELYLSLRSVSIDYALIEKVPDLLVVPASFDWMDLGSFADMHKAVGGNQQGNHIHGSAVQTDEVQNSFIQNHEDKPLAVIGLDNVVVINTPHGILVARKDLSQRVGDISKKFGA
jgi:mannose-1-phosphate guanylyltransferase/mannose-6-phosphate isomerase